MFYRLPLQCLLQPRSLQVIGHIMRNILFYRRDSSMLSGTRGVVTGKKLLDAIDSPLIDQVMTDCWKPYKHFVPPESHIQSKAETFTV